MSKNEQIYVPAQMMRIIADMIFLQDIEVFWVRDYYKSIKDVGFLIIVYKIMFAFCQKTQYPAPLL